MTALPADLPTRRAAALWRHLPPAAGLGVVLSQILWILVPADAQDALTVISVVLFAIASLSHAATTRGLRWAATYAVIAVTVGWTAEAIGTTTGWPFGDYSYTDSLGPKIGPVPLVIPLAWLMMAYPTLLAARRVAASRAGQTGYAAALLTSWDLFLDPQMVQAGHWTWHSEALSLPGIPGIPLQNYAGWFLVGLALFSAAALALPVERRRTDDRLPAAMLAWVYVSNVMAHAVFWGNPSVALVGGLAMGLLLVPWLRTGVLKRSFWVAQ